MIKPYNRLKDESAEAFEAFTVYRDLGPNRSHRETADKVFKTESIISKWSRRYSWVSRSLSWDRTVDSRKREARLRAIERMEERQVQNAVVLQEFAFSELLKLAALTEDSDHPVIQAKEILKYLTDGASLERVTLGKPDQIIENREENDVDYSKLDDVELKELKRIQLKMKKSDG